MNNNFILFIEDNLERAQMLFGVHPKRYYLDFSLWTNNEPFPGITWLFIGGSDFGSSLIGINENEEVWIIDDEGQYRFFCRHLQDFPYELLRLKSLNESSVYEIFSNDNEYQLFMQYLKEYEEWCINHDITLDIEHLYHNSNNHLFDKPFYMPNEVYQIIIADIQTYPFLTKLYGYDQGCKIDYTVQIKRENIEWKYYTHYSNIIKIGIKKENFSIWAEYHSGETKIISYDFLKIPEILGTKKQYPEENQQFIDYLKENELTIEPERYA